MNNKFISCDIDIKKKLVNLNYRIHTYHQSLLNFWIQNFYCDKNYPLI